MTTPSCLVCGTPTTELCSICKGASYCSQGHQQKVDIPSANRLYLTPSLFRLQHWGSHKEYCLKVKAAGANTFDAILFAVNETKPRLVKIPWKLIHGDNNDPTQYQKLDTNIWFRKKKKVVRPLFIRWWKRTNGPEFGCGLCIIYDENFPINGSRLNRCIVDATGGRGYPWGGNILALRMGGSTNPYSYDFYENVDIREDLEPLVTYFKECGKVTLVYQRSGKKTLLSYFWKALLYSVPIGFFWYVATRYF
jgi:hypothetical protein